MQALLQQDAHNYVCIIESIAEIYSIPMDFSLRGAFGTAKAGFFGAAPPAPRRIYCQLLSMAEEVAKIAHSIMYNWNLFHNSIGQRSKLGGASIIEKCQFCIIRSIAKLYCQSPKFWPAQHN